MCVCDWHVVEVVGVGGRCCLRTAVSSTLRKDLEHQSSEDGVLTALTPQSRAGKGCRQEGPEHLLDPCFARPIQTVHLTLSVLLPLTGS